MNTKRLYTWVISEWDNDEIFSDKVDEALKWIADNGQTLVSINFAASPEKTGTTLMEGGQPAIVTRFVAFLVVEQGESA